LIGDERHYAAAVLEPPTAKRVPHTWERPTGAVEDPWAWLSDRDDPDTLAYLEAENAYADAWLTEHAPLVDAIFDEIKARTQETDESVPTRKGPWWYASRTVGGLAYPIHCRGGTAATATEIVLLDENAHAESEGFFELGAFDVSPGHGLLAWSADVNGHEVFTMRVRDLATGADLPDRLEGTYYGTAWSSDDRHLFYTRPDHAMRPYQVWRHEVGTAQADDVLVYEEPDERYNVDLELSRSGSYVIITNEANTSTDVLVLPATDPLAAPHLVAERRPDIEYRLDHWGDRFVILTNLDAPDFKVVTAPYDSPGPAEWVDLVPHQAGRRITQIEPFADHLVLHEWADGQERIRVLRGDGSARTLVFDESVHSVAIGANPEYHSPTVRFEYQSLVTPRSVFEEDVTTGDRQLLKQMPVLGGYDPADYQSTREWAVAPDGTKVPVDAVWRRGTPLDGTAPLSLYGYGAYEYSRPPWFAIDRLSYLDRGGVWALSHPRGGGELGRAWYLDGKLLAKRNTFTDFLASAEHLVAQGYGAPDRVTIRGGSAGGLLVGACVTQRPGLYAGAIAAVPFVDVVTTMRDPSIPLTVTEWDEWGDPRTEPYASYMLGYSPYDNVVEGTSYPALYVTAGLNDPRVMYHEPAKWVAKLRATATTRGPLLLRTELGAGHGGPSGRYDTWRDEARMLAFLLVASGITG
jgi:oligopeptidase B